MSLDNMHYCPAPAPETKDVDPFFGGWRKFKCTEFDKCPRTEHFVDMQSAGIEERYHFDNEEDALWFFETGHLGQRFVEQDGAPSLEYLYYNGQGGWQEKKQ